MGAKQRAARRGNNDRKAAKNSMKGQPRSQKQLNQSILVPDLTPNSRAKSLQNWGNAAQSASPAAQHGFSMTEQARNTGRNGISWGTTSLRTQSIAFVSAGPLKRDEDAWNTVSEDDSPRKQSDAELGPEAPRSVRVQEEQHMAVRSKPQPQEEQLPTNDPTSSNQQLESGQEKVNEEPAHVSETIPEPSAPRSTAAETIPTTTSAPPRDSPASDTEEEIVFSGRLGGNQASRKPTPAPPSKADHQAQLAPPISDKVEASPLIAPTPVQPAVTKTIMSVFSTSNTLALDSQSETPLASRTRAKRSKGLPFGRKYDDDELMQDYIDNMALDDSEDDEDEDNTAQSTRRRPFKKTETFRMFNGDGLENEKVQTNGKKRASKHVPDQAIDWDSDELADFDDLSTTDDEVDEVDQVIRHRTRPSGPQYLVVATGTEASDAKWILHSKLVSETAVEEVRIYEEIREMNIVDEYSEDDDSDEDEDEDEEALQDLIDDIESEDDENARIMSYTTRMTDEQIARALAKQEELGLGSDELMLFDGDAAQEQDALDDAFGGGDDFIPFNIGKHTSNRSRTKRNKKQRDSFPSAEALADAIDQDPYGAFDIMDFDRPSLRPKKKGRKSDFPWDLEDLDEELKDQLVNTWTKDREKKAERKRQKEEARLEASLDAAEGGDPAIIKARIRQFLVQEIDTLRLSPMDSTIRAAVHRLAKSLKLNSRSEGKEGIGSGRYPVLTKTPRTPYYTIETIWEIDALMNTSKFFPKNRYDRKSHKLTRASGAGPRRGGGGVMSGVSYRDGEEVGAAAPELGADNKGRAMLEKMGWTAGMGIGAIGNKGSLDHVKHIVKTTKAGLG